MSTDLTDLLDRAFQGEPSQPAPADDVARGRRALRRNRTWVAAGALGVAAAVGLVAVLVPAVARSGQDQPAGFATTGDLTDAELARACVSTDNVASWLQGRGMREQRVLDLMGQARVMTRADTGQELLATVRSQDGRFWGECFVPYGDDPSYKHALSVFRTDVSFPSTEVDGVRVYRPQDESDPRLWGTDGSPTPGISVPCAIDEPEETAAYRDAQAACSAFVVTWVDRRPSEVAGAVVANPDGTEGRADVRDGYLAYAYRAPMTPAVAALFRSGDTGLGDAVTFLDHDGRVLARGGLTADPGARGGWPASASEGTPTIANYPSLAWWLTRDS